jgi:hypothetical protein
MLPLFKIFVISIFVLTSNIALSATKGSASEKNLNLVVELNDPRDHASVDRKIITFKSASRNFADYLSNGRGLWGTGPFKEFFCVKSRKAIIRDNSKSEKISGRGNYASPLSTKREFSRSHIGTHMDLFPWHPHKL